MEKEKTTGLAVKGFGMTMHFNTETEGVLFQSGYLNYPEHEMNGKRFVKTTVTPKIDPNPTGLNRWGEPVVSYHVEDGSDQPPVFTSIALLMEHYKLSLKTM